MTSNIAALRGRTKANLLERRQTDIPDNVYNMLKLSPGEKAEMTAHTLASKKSAVSLTHTFAPAHLMREFSDADLERESLITLMQKQGTRVSKADQIITAITATDYHAGIFSIPIGSPLLEIQCLMFDQGNKPCQFVTSYFQPDHYRYEMTLT